MATASPWEAGLGLSESSSQTGHSASPEGLPATFRGLSESPSNDSESKRPLMPSLVT